MTKPASQPASQSAPQAIPIRLRRSLLLGLAMVQAIMSPGVWNPLAGDGVWSTLVHLVPVCVAMAAACAFALARIGGGRVTRAELRWAKALVLNAVLPGVLWLALMIWNATRPVPAMSEPLPENVALVFMLAVGSFVIHGLPAQILAHQTKHALGQTDADWSPHRAHEADRFNTIVGVSVIAGGWTGGLGLLGYQLIDRARFGGGFEESLVDTISISVVFGEAFGAMLGLFAGLLLTLLILRTRLDRSIPVVIGAGMAFGIGGSLLTFIGGAATAVIGLGIAGAIARTRYKLIPLGQCQRCAYDMHGIADPVCPECGLHHEPGELA